MRTSWGSAVLLLGSLTGTVSGLELTTDVFPSVDEVREAWENGDISFEQFIRLQEIIDHGVNPSNRHLLDEIPNLAFFARPDSSLTDPLEVEQQSGLGDLTARSQARPGRVHGRIAYQFYQRLDEDEKNWYRSSADLVFRDQYRVRIRTNREKSGVERVVSRSLTYTNRRGRLRRLTLGNFSARLGLGTLFGYHGKRFDFSDEIKAESFAYPDYGGDNGLLAQGRIGSHDIEALLSIQRDSKFQMLSVGTLWQMGNKNWRPGLIIGFNRLVQRQTGEFLELPVLGFLLDHNYDAGYTAVEISRQRVEVGSAAVAVVEGRHRFQSADVRFAGWSYADDFIDLTSGSKAGYLTRTDTLELVGFRYSSRRSGQTGLLLRTIVDLNGGFDLANSLLLAGRARDDTKHQFSTSLIRRFDKSSLLQLTYLGRWRRRPEISKVREANHRFRLEGRFSAVGLAMRCYIGYEVAEDEPGSASLFVTAKYLSALGSEVQIWSNFGRVDSEGLNYWYLFGRVQWNLVSGLRMGTKFANTYRREAAEKHDTQVSLEVNVHL